MLTHIRWRRQQFKDCGVCVAFSKLLAGKRKRGAREQCIYRLLESLRQRDATAALFAARSI